jgi:hypothetical protein
MEDALPQDYVLLRRLLPRRLQPLLRRMDLPHPYRTVYPYTQCSFDR